MLIHLVCAARPNFMKIAPLYHALKKEGWAEPMIVHTGQHYDLNMSDAFFQDLRLPEPHLHLGVGSGTHAEQTGKVMMAYEKVLMEMRPDLVVVVGDVNSTMAATLAATKVVYPEGSDKIRVKSDKDLSGGQRSTVSSQLEHSSLPQAQRSSNEVLLERSGRQVRRPLVAHLEAGLRSFDRTMPEEVNRLVTDALADILWTPSPDANENLLREGVSREKIYRVGNIMIDSLEMLRGAIEKQTTYLNLKLDPGEYGVVTLHRPSNVDNHDVLSDLCASLVRISRNLPLVFPVHPRTRKSLEQNGLMKGLGGATGLHLTDPLSYIPFMNLVFHCRLAITDSGGLQEETTYLGIPCLTLRPNTERPVTVSEGTNQLCDIENIEVKVAEILRGRVFKGLIPEFWDGQTAGRVVKSITRSLK
jgi:UDP-N-acetylglucosamine 2-epimerase (non-hydrolysing)